MDHNHSGNGGLLMMVCSAFLYILSIFTLSQWAASATIFAALATGCYNGYKLILLYKQRRKNPKI